MNSAFKIKRRDDLIPTAVALKYRITGTWNNQQYVQIIHDIVTLVAPNDVLEGIGSVGNLQTPYDFLTNDGYKIDPTLQAQMQGAGRDFASLTATIDMEGNSNTIATCAIKTMPVNLADPSTGGGASLPFWKKVFPEFVNLAAPPSLYPGSTVTVTIDDPGQTDDGNAVDLSIYKYHLVDGQIPPWMLTNNTPGGAPAQAVQATISAQFVLNESMATGGHSLQTAQVAMHEKNARVTLLSIPGGTYQAQTSFTIGETIPYGLAGFIYNIATIPQYEGTFTIQENEITDPCPIGHNLNITGGLADWATMAAPIQNISYDLTAGRTTLSFGPAAHLGAQDFVERLRANRGIRNFYYIGANLAGSPGQNQAQLGNNVAQRGPSPGTRVPAVQTFPSNITDAAAHSYPNGVPGLTLDTTAAQPNYGAITGLAASALPTLFMAEGSAGTLGRVLRASLGDLPAGTQVFFQPCNVGAIIGGVCTDTVAYVLLGIPPP